MRSLFGDVEVRSFFLWEGDRFLGMLAGAIAFWDVRGRSFFVVCGNAIAVGCMGRCDRFLGGCGEVRSFFCGSAIAFWDVKGDRFLE